MNSTGGGLTHVSHIHSEEMRVFRGGLRHLPVHSELLQHNSKINLHNFHDKLSYERVFRMFLFLRVSSNTQDPPQTNILTFTTCTEECRSTSSRDSSSKDGTVRISEIGGSQLSSAIHVLP